MNILDGYTLGAIARAFLELCGVVYIAVPERTFLIPRP